MADEQNYNASQAPSEAQAEEGSSSSHTASSSSAPQEDQPASLKCTTCAVVPPDPETKPLKPCAKCKSVSYCSKECQKNDFKKHKKNCAELAQVYAKTADLRPARPSAPRDGFRGGLQKWQFDT